MGCCWVAAGPVSPTGRGSFFGRERGDWEIPYEELTFVKRLGEAGPGEVHHAKWHGDVAVKVWTIANPSEDMLRAFRREVCACGGFPAACGGSQSEWLKCT